MNTHVMATRARVAQDTQALEDRLARLHRQVGDVLDQLGELHAPTRAALMELDDLRTAQTASDHAVAAAGEPG